jgi:hypothetical protein
MAGATPMMLAWAGTMGLLLLTVGLAKARNAPTRAVVSGMALLFWIVFTFGSYGVFIGNTVGSRERFVMFGWLGLIMSLISFVVLVYNAIQILQDASAEAGVAT